MTVIAWDGQQLASDSMCSDSGGYFLTNTQKLFRMKEGAIIGTAGDDDCRALLHLFQDVKTFDDMPTRAEIADCKTTFAGLIVLPDKTLCYVESDYDYYQGHSDAWWGAVGIIKSKIAAMGHGDQFALAAMAAGKTAPEAVKIACKYSAFCRPPVQIMKLVDIKKAPDAEPVILPDGEQQ